MRRCLLLLISGGFLLAQYVDDRNLFEILQDDLNTAMAHAHLSLDQRRVLNQSTTTLVKAAAKLRARKAFDKAEVKRALQAIALTEDANVFRPEDRQLVAADRGAVELGVAGKLGLYLPRRAPGTVY